MIFLNDTKRLYVQLYYPGCTLWILIQYFLKNRIPEVLSFQYLINVLVKNTLTSNSIEFINRCVDKFIHKPNTNQKNYDIYATDILL